jgi:hypothetical protein
MTCQSLCAPENTLTSVARQLLDSMFARVLCIVGVIEICIRAWFACSQRASLRRSETQFQPARPDLSRPGCHGGCNQFFLSRSATVRTSRDLAGHDTWSNSQLQELVKAHGSLIRDYKCTEWQLQDPIAVIHAPVAPADVQAPQASTPLLIPPLNHLALLEAARAHGENAVNAQDKDGHGLRMPDQRRITAAIMREWAPHRDARALGAPHDRSKAKQQRHFT